MLHVLSVPHSRQVFTLFIGHEGPQGEQRYSCTLSRTLALDGGGGSATRPGRLYPRERPSTIVQEAGWAPGPVWTGGKSHPHRDSILDRPACSQSLYRLSYLAHLSHTLWFNNAKRIGTQQFGVVVTLCNSVLKVPSLYL